MQKNEQQKLQIERVEKVSSDSVITVRKGHTGMTFHVTSTFTGNVSYADALLSAMMQMTLPSD